LSGPTAFASDWTIKSGTWGGDTPSNGTLSTDALAISNVGSGLWQQQSINITNLYKDDKARFGWSDSSGDNRVFIEVKHNVVTYPVTISARTYYDETYDRFYFQLSWLYFGITLPTSTITYTVYSVTAGGAETVIDGPTVLTATTVCGSNPSIYGDSYVTLHASMKRLMFGTGDTMVKGVGYTWSGQQNYCECGGSDVVPPLPRKYTVAVAGVATSNAIDTCSGADQYFDVSLLNRSATLRNSWSTAGGVYPCGAANGICCHGYFEPLTCFPSYQISTHRFWALWSGGNTQLWGTVNASYVYPCPPDDPISISAEITFYKELAGLQEIRDMSGEVLPFLLYRGGGSGDGYIFPTVVDWLNCASATYTVTAVP